MAEVETTSVVRTVRSKGGLLAPAWLPRLALSLASFWLLAVSAFALIAARDLATHQFGLLRQYPARAASFVFVLTTVGLATALAAGVGLFRPALWRRAVFALAIVPIPLLLATSRNLEAACTVLALLLPALWLGREVMGRALPSVGRPDVWVVGATFGIAALVALGYLLGALGLLRPQVIWPVLLLLVLVLLAGVRRRLGDDIVAAQRWLATPAPPAGTAIVLVGLLIGFYWLNLIGALAPEIVSDAVRLRLPVSAAFARSGQLTIPPEFVHFHTPQVGEVFYATVLASAPLQGAKLANLLVGLLCGVVVWSLSRRLGGERAGLVAALTFYTLPLTMWLSQTAYVDLLSTLFASTAALLLVMHERPALRAIIAATACIAVGYYVKSSFGLIAVGLAIATGLAILWSGRLPTRLVVLGLAAGTVLLSLLWTVRDAAPVQATPGFATVRALVEREWAGRMAQVNLFNWFTPFGGERSLTALARSPLDLTLHSRRYGENQDGFVGYLLLALTPLVMLCRPNRRGSIMLLGVILAYFAWFSTVQYLRYALPMFAIAAALGGAAFVTIGERDGRGRARAVMTWSLTLLAGLGLFGFLNTILVYPGTFPYRVVLGQQGREEYLREHLGAYTALRLLDAEEGADQALTPREYARLYTRVPLHRTIHLPGIGYHTPPTEGGLLQLLDKESFTHIVVDRADLPPEWHALTVMDEEFLRRNAELVGGERNAYLYRFVSPERRGVQQPWARGRELLPNGGFEEGRDGRPVGWTPEGGPAYDTAGQGQGGTAGAVLAGGENAFQTTVPVIPGARYLLSHATRSGTGEGLARLQINWMTAAGELAGVSIEIVPATPDRYRPFSMLATAPPGVASATVYVQAQRGEVWFDDVSLRAVEGDSDRR